MVTYLQVLQFNSDTKVVEVTNHFVIALKPPPRYGAHAQHCLDG